MHAEGENAWEHAVAAAMTSKIGVGNAAFHTGGEAGPGRDRVPRRLPPRGAGAAGRLQRGVHPRPGLGAELPHPGGGRPDLVLARAEGAVPPAALRARRSPSSTRTTAAGAMSSPATTRAPSTCATSPRRPPCARSRRASCVGAALTPWAFVVPGRLPRGDQRRARCPPARGCRSRPALQIPVALATMHMSLGLRLPDQPAVAGQEGHRDPPPRGPHRLGLSPPAPDEAAVAATGPTRTSSSGPSRLREGPNCSCRRSYDQV